MNDNDQRGLCENCETVRRHGSSRQPGKPIWCPCCRRALLHADVWYDCRCFQGGHKPGCDNCTEEPPERDARIAATIREWGWDKDPSPGMLDYLTPGWRGPAVQARAASGGDGGGETDDGIPF